MDVSPYISFASKLAREFRRAHFHPALSYEELQSAAFLGLCEAACRFDSARGLSFETFAYLRIRGAMFDYLRFVTEERVEAGQAPHAEPPEAECMIRKMLHSLLLTDDEKLLLRLRYVLDYSFAEIAKLFGGRSKSWAHSLHDEVLGKLRLHLSA